MDGEAITAAVTHLTARRLLGRAANRKIATQCDEDIVLLVIEGNTDAFEVLVKRHQDFVFTLARGIVKSDEPARDVAQETFLRAYRAIRHFEHRSSFKTWLYRIAYNTAMNHCRDEDGNCLAIDDLRIEDVESAKVKHTLRLTFERLIGLLKPELQAVIMFHYYDSLKYEEIAEIMNCPLGTVKIRLFRAKHELRRLWEKYAD